MTGFEIAQLSASVATSVGVIIATYQLVQAKRQARSDFEDGLTQQYRGITAELPLQALLGERLTDQALLEHLRTFYTYFDLCNEQAFLSRKKRIRPDTWVEWREGISQHMARPAFQQAWQHLLPSLGGSFDDFRAVLADTPSEAGTLRRGE